MTSTNRPSRNLSIDDKWAAVNKLEARVAELKAIDDSGIRRADDEPVASVAKRILSTLASIYGEGTSEYDRLQIASDLDMTIYSYMNDTATSEIQAGVSRGKIRAIATLQGEIDVLREDLSLIEVSRSPTNATEPVKKKELSREVFVVHGRDDAAKVEVARLIERAGLEAIILHEQANGGRTIIQKFEDHGGAAGFAIVIMTPDDVGGLDKDSLQPRARQNVIGEMFWFAGRLGRDRVCALKKGLIEVPTDFAGVGYVDMDATGAWKKDVLRELEHAGYKGLDWQRALA
ncbi:nucleotide-binding protein [Bradyrhizobium yuanmingense]|uniref:nucleotide-binding protein n=1 Tax=Bradyrhizobium yuanmingense TaxID=108015 RepID=UPI0023B8E756|nr:nucleotide-binding protein [Bradyrhizobium yuanmingense]MDF0579224.1 nucleotide-binding protein [Bradyrhizobium yuanmingense]